MEMRRLSMYHIYKTGMPGDLSGIRGSPVSVFKRAGSGGIPGDPAFQGSSARRLARGGVNTAPRKAG